MGATCETSIDQINFIEGLAFENMFLALLAFVLYNTSKFKCEQGSENTVVSLALLGYVLFNPQQTRVLGYLAWLRNAFMDG